MMLQTLSSYKEQEFRRRLGKDLVSVSMVSWKLQQEANKLSLAQKKV